MASTTITLNEEAYQRLKQAKQKGESFSAVVLRSIHRKADTFGELLDMDKDEPLPQIDMEMLDMIDQPGRRRKR